MICFRQNIHPNSHQVLNELQQAGGRPGQAGWLAWDEIIEEWGGEEEIEAETASV